MIQTSTTNFINHRLYTFQHLFAQTIDKNIALPKWSLT